jgi:hypothetical protein
MRIAKVETLVERKTDREEQCPRSRVPDVQYTGFRLRQALSRQERTGEENEEE